MKKGSFIAATYGIIVGIVFGIITQPLGYCTSVLAGAALGVILTFVAVTLLNAR